MPSGYALAWEAGASAQIELFSPELDLATAERDYRLKFSPPMRRTIRPPMTPLQLGHTELEPIIGGLNRLGQALDARRVPVGGAAAAAAGATVLDQAKEAGGNLFSLIIPNDVQIELEGDDLFLEIGVDEALLEYPWELLHDGTEFLCLKHSIGRFVNVGRVTAPKSHKPEAMGIRPLSVLVISVPTPQPRVRPSGNITYDTLHGVDQETAAVVQAITDLGPNAELQVLKGANANWNAVVQALKTGRHHIIHYSGHASFDSANPFNSCLALYDQDMTTGHIRNFCKHPPVLFFINGCESTVARGVGNEWKNRYDIFGLARAFLDTGAYLLGSRWKVGDAGAAKFAEAFYAEVLAEKPFGRAIMRARNACKDGPDDDFAWASYVYYGDPRVRFRKVDQG
jgi:CHAT domain-containing protein